MITILAVGKKTDGDLINAIESYQKRLRAPFNVKWLSIPYSAKDGVAARRGQQMTSPEFSRALSCRGDTTIIIGGAYGVNDELRQRANQMVSLSKMVFPHQLVRLILIEQIYRAQAIYNHHPYHHE